MSGRPLDSRGLAKLLREYMTADNSPSRPATSSTGGGVLKGYYAADLARRVGPLLPPTPWKVRYFRYRRYLPAHRPETGSGNPGFLRYHTRNTRYRPQPPPRAGSGIHPLPLPTSATTIMPLTRAVAEVAEVADLTGRG